MKIGLKVGIKQPKMMENEKMTERSRAFWEGFEIGQSPEFELDLIDCNPYDPITEYDNFTDWNEGYELGLSDNPF